MGCWPTVQCMLLAYVPILVHEGTLVHALQMLSPWCAKFSTDVPTKLIEWFKVGRLGNSASISHALYIHETQGENCSTKQKGCIPIANIG